MSENKTSICVELLAVLKDGVRGLTQGACLTCGSEPGCNIDCAGCRWVARAEAAIAKAEGKNDENGPEDWDSYFAALASYPPTPEDR